LAQSNLKPPLGCEPDDRDYIKQESNTEERESTYIVALLQFRHPNSQPDSGCSFISPLEKEISFFRSFSEGEDRVDLFSEQPPFLKLCINIQNLGKEGQARSENVSRSPLPDI